MPLKITSRSRASSWSKEDYPHIHRGFIAPHYHIPDAMETYYCPNNETANVYTQLAGLLAFAFMFLTLHLAPNETLINTQEYHNVTSDQIEKRRFYFQFAIASVVMCCISSLVTHTFQSRSRRWHDVLAICDWGGILVIVFCATLGIDLGSDAHEIIEHHVDAQWLQQILIWSTGTEHLKIVCIGLILTLATLTFCQTSHAFRFLLIFIVILISCMPFIFLNFLLFPLKSIVGIIAVAAGGFFFGSHIPEIWYSRTFDIVMPSHSLWHLGYESCLILTFDSMSILFFGQSCYSWENMEAAIRYCIQFLVLLC